MIGVILEVIVVLLIIFLIAGVLYTKFGILKFLYHDILGWHMPDENASSSFDGCSVHSICKHCGKDIMQDSQGNWF